MKVIQPKPIIGLRVVLLWFCVVAFGAQIACQNKPSGDSAASPASEEKLQEAIKRIEEDRGQPTGRKVRLEVPAELKHYADRRRFLAVQNAAWSKWHFEIPQGYLELIELIEKGGFVEMEPLGDAHVLYGAGENATTARFTHYDAASGKSVVLLGSLEEYESERQRLAAARTAIETSKVEVQTQVDRTPAKARAARQTLLSRLRALEEEIRDLGEEQSRLVFFYHDPARRMMMFARYSWLQSVAANFGGASYDIEDPTQRRQFKIRLLAFTRPKTRQIINEIAHAYKERFGRHLPITSLFRTLEYQRLLREVNPNATSSDVPPHTTGLAVDIYDRYMTGEEQQFLMGIIAGMKAAGRIEALRENRDHIHIFVFPGGTPPDEKLIVAALKNRSDDKKAGEKP